MPAPTLAAQLQEFFAGSQVDTLTTQFNALADAVNALCAHLDADTGVASTDYTATFGQTAKLSLHK